MSRDTPGGESRQAVRAPQVIRLTFVGLTFLFVTSFAPSGAAGADPAAELKKAQAALSAGEYDKAYPQYLHFAEQGNSLAQFTLGMYYRNGWGGIAPDPAAACAWFEKSAAGDIPTAAHYLGECFEQGIGRAADPAKAAFWYERAGNLGHYLSLCSLADLYMRGAGVAKDPQKGLELCMRAAEKGSTPASVRVGRYLLEGDESIRDPEAAQAWFESASASPQADYYLGIMHRDGLGLEASPDEARDWFERAAGEGFVPAYFPTASLYFEIAPDYDARRPSAEVLAKTYMWLSATLQRSRDPKELEDARAMLEKVLTIMPANWVATLDERVAEHMGGHPPIP